MAHRSACSENTEDSEWGPSESSELEWRGSATPNLFAGSHPSRETEATSPQASFSSYTHQGLAEELQDSHPRRAGVVRNREEDLGDQRGEESTRLRRAGLVRPRADSSSSTSLEAGVPLEALEQVQAPSTSGADTTTSSEQE